MHIGEFIDAYSDDLITIYEARAAAYTHPLRTDYAFADALLDASFCRILVVFVIGAIEAMLDSWRHRDKLNALHVYFSTESNFERVNSLCQAFTDAGIQVERQVFDDYLAIKYLRNTIIHGRWKDHEKGWLDARGFPNDTQKLTKQHMDKIEYVSQNLMLYIALTDIADRDALRRANLVKLDETITRHKDETGVLRLGDIARIIWNNLERIDALICSDINKAVITKLYDWTEGRSRADLETLGNEEQKRLLYLAARRAANEDYEPLVRHRTLANEALEFWREYWQRSIASRGLNEERIQRALRVFRSPDFRTGIADWSAIGNAPDDVVHRLVENVLSGDESFTSNQIVNALGAGKLAYEIVPNIMPLTLFTVRLPIVDPANTATYLREAQRALDLLRLKRAWYECVEHRRQLTDEGLGFYVRMCREFAGHS